MSTFQYKEGNGQNPRQRQSSIPEKIYECDQNVYCWHPSVSVVLSRSVSSTVLVLWRRHSSFFISYWHTQEPLWLSRYGLHPKCMTASNRRVTADSQAAEKDGKKKNMSKYTTGERWAGLKTATSCQCAFTLLLNTKITVDSLVDLGFVFNSKIKNASQEHRKAGAKTNLKLGIF